MKITICGSLAFAKEILDIEEKLKLLGHETVVPLEAKSFVSEITNDRNLNPELGRKGMLGHYHEIAKGDAVLICNFEKNNIPGYIGGATLMELGIAYYTAKKIFLLNEIPNEKDVRYAQEIKLMQPIIINNDLSLIR